MIGGVDLDTHNATAKLPVGSYPLNNYPSHPDLSCNSTPPTLPLRRRSQSMKVPGLPTATMRPFVRLERVATTSSGEPLAARTVD